MKKKKAARERDDRIARLITPSAQRTLSKEPCGTQHIVAEVSETMENLEETVEGTARWGWKQKQLVEEYLAFGVIDREALATPGYLESYIQTLETSSVSSDRTSGTILYKLAEYSADTW